MIETASGAAKLAGLPFRKMHGLGNDFVVIDTRIGAPEFTKAELERIADRRFGIGCDQLILLEASDIADIRMRIFNPDGGEVEACGNATRCVASLIGQEKLVEQEKLVGQEKASRTDGYASPIRIETVAGTLIGSFENEQISIDMGLPETSWAAIPLAGSGEDTLHIPLDCSAIEPALPKWFTAVNMGNPHGVFFLDNVDHLDLTKIGPLLETHPIFPRKANISFAEVISPHHIKLRVWERAAGITLACGSAACATGVAALNLGLCSGSIRVDLPGGTLQIRQDQHGHVIMTGPAAEAFTGTLSTGMFGASGA